MSAVVNMTHCAAATVHDARRGFAQKSLFPHQAKELLQRRIIPALRFVLGYFQHLMDFDVEDHDGPLGFAEPYLNESRGFLRKEQLYRDRLVREMPAQVQRTPLSNEEKEQVRNYVLCRFRLARLSTFEPENTGVIEQELRRKNLLESTFLFVRFSAELRAQYLREVAVADLTISITEGHLTARSERDLVDCISHELGQCLEHLANF